MMDSSTINIIEIEGKDSLWSDIDEWMTKMDILLSHFNSSNYFILYTASCRFNMLCGIING